MINHNSNIIEAGLQSAGSGSLYLQYAVMNLYASQYSGSGSWNNPVGANIQTSGSFVDSGSLGWGFNGASLLIEPSLTLPNLATTGFTLVWYGTVGTSNNTKQTLLFNNISDTSFGEYGFQGSANFYNPVSWSLATCPTASLVDTIQQKGSQPGDTPCSGDNMLLLANSLSQPAVYSLSYYPSTDTLIQTINDVVIKGPINPYAGNSFEFNNTTNYTFGNFPAATNGAAILARYARFRGSVKRMILYTTPLSTGQIVRQVFPAIVTGA